MMITSRQPLILWFASTALLCFMQDGEAFVTHVHTTSTKAAYKLAENSSTVGTISFSNLQAFRSRPADTNHQPGWHRRVLRKVFRRNGSHPKSTLTSASTIAIDMHDISSFERANRVQDGVFLSNIQLQSPERLLALRQNDSNQVTLASEVAPLATVDVQNGEVEVANQKEVVENDATDSKRSSFGIFSRLTGNAFHSILSPLATVKEVHLLKGQEVNEKEATDSKRSSVGVFSRLTGNAFQNILTTRLNRWSDGRNEGMIIQCSPCNTNSIFTLLRGKFQCDAALELDRIVFGNIRFSGGRLEVQRFGLNLWSFLEAARTGNQTSPRYLNQFDFVGHNLTMTQDDLFESNCIRNGLQRLLTRILRNRGMEPKEVTVKSIKILPSGVLSVVGEAVPKLLGAPAIPFEVHTGLGISSRGHILTFPGLKISLMPGKGFFVPIVPEVLTLDLGNNAKLLSVNIDGESRELHLSAKVTITPEHTVHTPKQFKQSSKAYAAMCSFDVGQWLTNLGRFAH